MAVVDRPVALAQAGLSREAAYKLVQRNAMATWKEGGSFKERLLNDPELLSGLSGGEADGLDELFDPRQHLNNLDYIFEKVFGRAGD